MLAALHCCIIYFFSPFSYSCVFYYCYGFQLYFCFFFLMIRRPPRSTLFPYTDALPIAAQNGLAVAQEVVGEADTRGEVVRVVCEGLSLVAKSEVQSQVARRAPVVLREQRPGPLADAVGGVAERLLVAYAGAERERRGRSANGRGAACGRGERELSLHEARAELLTVAAGGREERVAAELQEVFAARERQGVCGLILVVDEYGRARLALGRDARANYLRRELNGVELRDRRADLHLHARLVEERAAEGRRVGKLSGVCAPTERARSRREREAADGVRRVCVAEEFEVGAARQNVFAVDAMVESREAERLFVDAREDGAGRETRRDDGVAVLYVYLAADEQVGVVASEWAGDDAAQLREAVNRALARERGRGTEAARSRDADEVCVQVVGARLGDDVDGAAR